MKLGLIYFVQLLDIYIVDVLEKIQRVFLQTTLAIKRIKAQL